MYIVAQHEIADPVKFLDVAHVLFMPAEGMLLMYFFPNTDMTQAVSVWSAGSLSMVKNVLDGTLGSSSRNTYFHVDLERIIESPCARIPAYPMLS